MRAIDPLRALSCTPAVRAKVVASRPRREEHGYVARALGVVLDPIGIAIEVAQALGLHVEQPVTLRSTNNAVVWLSPTRVVAKVGVGRKQRLRAELQVALELFALGGPVVSPAPELPPVVHSRAGLDVTFWQYHAQNSVGVIAAGCVATSLRRLHATLSRISPDLRATLPSYLEELDYVRALLTDSASLSALSEGDRHLLATTFDRLKAELGALSPPDSHVAIHGAPHLYNVLLADGEPRFIDFETACTGPVEWDLAHLDSEGEPFYGSLLKSRLLWVCRGMASVKAAVFCWADFHHGDLRDHAEWHLNHVRTTVAPYTIHTNVR
jgi:hypothetical protein